MVVTLENTLANMNSDAVDDVSDDASYDSNSRLEQAYVNAAAKKEGKFSKEYFELRNDKARARYIMDLVRNKEYFSAYQLYTHDMCKGKPVGNKQRLVEWADKLVDKLCDAGVPGVIPIYTTIMYQIGGIKRGELADRVKLRLKEKGISSSRIKGILGWHPEYKSYLN